MSQGTMARRAGGKSFGNLDSSDAPPSLLAVMPENVPRQDEQSIEAQVHREVNKAIAARCLAVKEETSEAERAQRATVEHVLTRSQNLPQTVAEHMSLQSTPGAWLLDVAGAEACSMIHKASDVVAPDLADSIASLSSRWQINHKGISNPQLKPVKGIRESPCFSAGSCHCRRSLHGTRTRQMWQAAQTKLKRLFPQKADMLALQNAESVLLWGATSSDGRFLVRATHVSAMSLRPWRPTFLELLPHSVDELVALEGVFRRRWSGEVSEDMQRITMVVATQTDNADLPLLQTQFSFIESLPQVDWWLVPATLSQDPVPFPNSAGLVRIVVRGDAEATLWWDPSTYLRRQRQAAEEKEYEEEGEQEQEDLGEEEVDGAFGFDKGLLALWEEIAEDPPSNSEDSSSSSSSKQQQQHPRRNHHPNSQCQGHNHNGAWGGEATRKETTTRSCQVSRQEGQITR